MRTARTGFTLIEVLVALTLSALVLALSQRILTVLMDGDAALGRTAHRAAIAAEGLRQGRVLVARALPLTPEGRPFIGATDAAEFDSLCESGRGGFTRCRVTIYRGVYPVPFDTTQRTPEVVYPAIFKALLEKKLVDLGDRIIVTKGEFSGVSGKTNSMKILEVRL